MEAQAKIAQILSFSLIWLDPVPKLSSPHKEIFPASIKFPKNFHPVGTSNLFSIPSLAATLSMAPLVGILLATPAKGVLNTAVALAAIIAKLSEGVTKNYLPKIIFLSASPSQAAPNDYNNN